MLPNKGSFHIYSQFYLFIDVFLTDNTCYSSEGKEFSNILATPPPSSDSTSGITGVDETIAMGNTEHRLSRHATFIGNVMTLRSMVKTGMIS